MRPQDTRILHNKDLTLECIVKGYPLPRVTWFKDGQQITLTTTGRYVQLGTHNLKVSSVQPGDTGRYECVVGSQKAVANVQVIGMV